MNDVQLLNEAYQTLVHCNREKAMSSSQNIGPVIAAVDGAWDLVGDSWFPVITSSGR